MILAGKPEELEKNLLAQDANLGKVLERSSPIPAQLYRYQAMALYLLAQPYNHMPILEIGTGQGYSTSIMAQACPRSAIITLNPNRKEATLARTNLLPYRNVVVIEEKSWDFAKGHKGDYGFIFIDGDHKHVDLDLVWYKFLKQGGLIVFHDYDEVRSSVTFECLKAAQQQFGKFDILIMDANRAGMVGWKRRS